MTSGSRAWRLSILPIRKPAPGMRGTSGAMLDMGVDCFKTDFGERIPTDVVWHDGSDPEGMHNLYSVLYNECVFNVLEEVRGKGEAVLFARSSYASGQRFPAALGRRLLVHL